jgi:MFS superfamily sulfate permease-like transporter
MAISARPVSIAQRLLPILGWLPAYRREWLLPDVLAGLAVWAVMVPEGMAYSGIVGVPPITGLYTIIPPLIVYALLGTSRLLVVGPDTATGLISALTVGALAAQGTADFNTLTSTLAILIGAFFLLFGALRMGWVAAFIPTPVMRGFIEGLVFVTILGEVPHLLGINGTSGNFFTKLWFVLQHLPRRFARNGADGFAQPRSNAVAPLPGTPSTRDPGRCGRGHDSRWPARR